jgi:hypothetical protein
MKSPIGSSALVAFLLAASCAHNSAQTGQSAGPSDLDDESDTVAPRACTAATTQTAPRDGKIATFTDKVHGTDFAVELIAYPVGEAIAPKVATADGTLHITANVPVTDKAQYVGVAMTFPKCVDASAFTGVRFSIRGDYRGCSMQYATADVSHEDRTTKAIYATGRKGSYPPQAKLEKSQVGAVAQTLSIPFSESTIRGQPALPLDRSKLTALVWQFTVSLAANIDDGTTVCVADLNIDDVAFY